MVGIHEPGCIAHWIARPSQGVNCKPFAFDYMRRES